ncbi:MAG: PEGA domain-containing protein, partial [OM182 bacterium]|nr:PEGA domain-containing protein [OM182 bacterium]
MSELHDDEIEVIDFEPVTETKRGFSYRFRWLHAFLAVFGAAALLSAWFVLTARSVLVDVNPITAQIEIKEGFALKVGARYLMRSGDYSVALSNPGFHDELTALVIDDEAAQTHSFDMRKLPGIVTINSTPAGGRVRIDGVDLGIAPLAELDVEPGTHEISITRERYLPATQTIDIEGRRQQQAFELSLAPAWATVSFTTTPAGAELFVDGESAGTTPLNAE